MTAYVSAALRQRLTAVDDHRCAYCRTTSRNTGQPMSIDHVIPQAQGGSTEFENLCYACRRCNEFKGSKTTGIDPLTGEITSLFHPRRDHWLDHFAWENQGLRVVGRTAIGRATVIILNMNNEYIVASRRIWISAGWHPPIES